jgi:hypothetical protein
MSAELDDEIYRPISYEGEVELDYGEQDIDEIDWTVIQKKKLEKFKEKITDAPRPLPVPCRFFRLGKCAAGKSCRFLHDNTNGTTPPSTNGTNGVNGVSLLPNPTASVAATSTSSTLPSTSPPPVSTSNILCKFHAVGYCRNGSKCPFLHASRKPSLSTGSKSLPSAPFMQPPSPPRTSGLGLGLGGFPVSSLSSSPLRSIPSLSSLDGNSVWASSPPQAQSSSLPSSLPFSSPPPRIISTSLPSLASLSSSPSFLSSSPLLYPPPEDEIEEEEDDDDELPAQPPGLTIIDDAPDDLVFNPFDDIHVNSLTNASLSINSNSSSANNGGNSLLDDFFPNDALYQHLLQQQQQQQQQIQQQVPKSYSEIVKGNVLMGVQEQQDSEDRHDSANRLCQFYMQGICRYGLGCRYIHGNMCDSCLKPCLLPDNLAQNDEHRQVCRIRMRIIREREESKDVECGICFEKPVEKGRRFGLLSHCDHPFCLECIREWRGGGGAPTSTLRSCPICRVTSYFIIPFDASVVDPDRKQEIIEQYKAKLATITCKYFNKGKGTCKFGTSCMYSHLNSDGTPYAPPPVRKMQDSDGEIMWYNGLKLGMFMDEWL